MLKFGGDFLYTALNAFVFGVVLGGAFNWIRRAGFLAQRNQIAIEAASLCKNLGRISAWAFSSIATRDVAEYRKAKSAASKFQNELSTFLTDYAPYFSPSQAVRFKQFKRAAEEISRRLDWGNVTKEMHENEAFKLETMGWLFEADRFGGLGQSTFEAAEGLMHDFLKALGLWWWRRREYMTGSKAKDAADALLSLKAEVERATGRKFAALPCNLFDLEAA